MVLQPKWIRPVACRFAEATSSEFQRSRLESMLSAPASFAVTYAHKSARRQLDWRMLVRKSQLR